MNSKLEFKIDWASHESAKYACENWHYSKCLPVPPLVKIGVWENKKFIGCVIFSRGASSNLLKPYGLTQVQGCELTRIALNKHVTPVSRIISIAIKFLKKNSPELKLIISFADPNEGHHGGVYQATNWVYSGKSAKSFKYLDKMDENGILDKYLKKVLMFNKAMLERLLNLQNVKKLNVMENIGI
jgi:hypothetical protein